MTTVAASGQSPSFLWRQLTSPTQNLQQIQCCAYFWTRTFTNWCCVAITFMTAKNWEGRTILDLFRALRKLKRHLLQPCVALYVTTRGQCHYKRRSELLCVYIGHLDIEPYGKSVASSCKDFWCKDLEASTTLGTSKTLLNSGSETVFHFLPEGFGRRSWIYNSTNIYIIILLTSCLLLNCSLCHCVPGPAASSWVPASQRDTERASLRYNKLGMYRIFGKHMVVCAAWISCIFCCLVSRCR